MSKEYWPSRTSFVLAAIGSAIGLGNVWRFPYICVKYGGGAFLIPYLVALFTAGIPLMVLEMGLGHKMEASAPVAFRGTGKGREWVGWMAVGVGFMIICYYAVIMGWCANYFRYSFNLTWGANTEDFFYNQFLNKSSNMKDIFSISGPILAGLLISWVLIILCVWKGARSVGKVVYLTVPLPWICLVLFVIKGLSLPGAEQGIAYYLTPNFAALRDSSVWLAAYGQIFFSLSIAFGVMIAYASFLPKKSDIVNNAFIVSLANCGTSFLGGFAVFATLGHYAHQMGLDMEGLLALHPDKAKGFGLVFLTYPTIISQLGRAASFFGAVFFIMLMTLAIDSAFSLVEAAAAAFMDKYNAARLKANFGVAIVAIIVGLVFTTRSGYYWLDVTDYFMNSFGIVAVALLECLVIGYFYGTKHIREYVNSKSEFSIGKWWDVMIMFVTPVILSISIALEIKARVLGAYEGIPRWVEFAGGWSVVIALPVISILLMRSRTRRPA
ncbi:MAG: sodium-dependent transporter [Candidatus Eisenbacteria bacterium]